LNEVHDISAGQILAVLSRRSVLISLASLAGAVFAAVFAFMSPAIYRAEVLLAPAESTAFGVSTASNQLDSYATLSLGRSMARRSEALATLQSRALTESFVRELNLLPVLFSDAWDVERGRWRTRDGAQTPSFSDANDLIDSKIRKVSDDLQTGLVTLSIEWTDPELVAKWATELVTRTNMMVRERVVRDAERDIAFLQRQLQSTTAVEVRKAFIYQ
jgi:uncharacterized protein involved in exopolysaccharide biosynthesis